MPRIDTHQHFWKFDPVRDSWINEEMSVIRKDFFPADLQPLLAANGFDGCVAVQADQSIAENDFLLLHAAQNDFIKGVVGWVDLQADDIAEKLSNYRGVDKLKGFRHVLQGEPDRALMLKPAFKKGIGLLKQFGFTYDILIFPDQLTYVRELVASFPDQPFVIDHIAKPYIKDRKLDEWKKDMQSIAHYENVYCKVSGMVTEADWKQWKQEDMTPYLDVVTTAFGAKRILFGSDWPVCLVAASYQQVINIVKEYFNTFSNNEQDMIFGGNAIQFYHL